MRCVGTVIRGIRTPIIKENDDLATIVVDSLMAAKESEGFEFKDKDIVAITEIPIQKHWCRKSDFKQKPFFNYFKRYCKRNG